MHKIAHWDRNFRVWAYTVSHSQLLLRSVSYSDADTRIEVNFDNTKFMSLPKSFESLHIMELTHEETQEYTRKELPRKVKAFLLNDDGAYVLATHCLWHEDDGHDRSPSHFGPFPPVY